jgi:predicted MPP superfamily phosphohydrolase
LKIENWEFRISKLPSLLDGIRICQISDLHMTGMATRDFYQYVMARVNAARPDLVFLTGDILDDRRCIDWIPQILSNVNSAHGCYYVLGNHDRRIRDTAAIHERMSAAGWVHVADGGWHSVPAFGRSLWLAGNEIPWYRHAEQLPSDLPTHPSPILRILLSHSPDQIDWALHRGFDLMFAGHTHGGQIQIPLIGPIVAPSRHGVKYASGTFCFGKLLVHVSRGLGADEPIRLFCPPELGFFKLLNGGGKLSQ